MNPTELRLGQFTRRFFSGTRASQNEDDVGFRTRLPRVEMVKHDLRRRCNSLLVNMSFFFVGQHLIFTRHVVGKVTIETADSPGLIGIGV